MSILFGLHEGKALDLDSGRWKMFTIIIWFFDEANHCRLLAGEYPRNRDEESSVEKLGVDVEAGITAFLQRIIFWF